MTRKSEKYHNQRQKPLTENVLVDLERFSVNSVSVPELQKIVDTCEKIPYLPLPRGFDTKRKPDSILIAPGQSSNAEERIYSIYYTFGEGKKSEEVRDTTTSQRVLDKKIRSLYT